MNERGKQLSKLQQFMVTKFDYFVFLSIVIWLTILSLYSIVYVYSVVKENPTTLFTITAELTLMIIEFFVTLGYPIIFYFFYKQTKSYVSMEAFKRIRSKLLFYFVCMSCLITTRFVYYVYEVTEKEFTPTSQISYLQLLPSFLSELAFSILILI